MTKEHAKILAESTKAVENSERTIRETTKKVKKLFNDVTQLMADFRSTSDKNTEAANKVITSLRMTLHHEKEALMKVCTDLRVDNAEMSASIVSKIEKLQADLDIENNIMDQLVVKTKKRKSFL